MLKRLKMSVSTVNKCVISSVFCRLLPDYYHGNRREKAESESSKLDSRRRNCAYRKRQGKVPYIVWPNKGKRDEGEKDIREKEWSCIADRLNS